MGPALTKQLHGRWCPGCEAQHCHGGWEAWGPPELGTDRISHFPSREKRATLESRFVATGSSVGEAGSGGWGIPFPHLSVDP